MKVFYGISECSSIDVTEICKTKMTFNNVTHIPCGDLTRSSFFTDPYENTIKKIFINCGDIISSYDDTFDITINLTDNTIEAKDASELCKCEMDHNCDTSDIYNYPSLNTASFTPVNATIELLHSKLTLKHGSFTEELPEQKMVVRYFSGFEKVLEIGGNIGRNSLIIASILKNSENFVTLESSPSIAQHLIENRDLNNFNFHIENSALSNRRLFQRGWVTIPYPSSDITDDYVEISTITLNELKNKYNIEFDTLVLDCEGAFYYILLDMPEILTGINLIVMENDYTDLTHKNYVDEILLQNEFVKDYCQCGGEGPCYSNFYEVWKKK
jgi:FkbM family methyltransferase